MKKIQMTLGFLLILPLFIIGCSAKQKEEPFIFKLAEIHHADYPTSLANQKFATLVEEKTGGTVKIEVHTDGVLGEEIDVVEKLQYGSLAFARVSIAPMAEFSSKLNVLMLPYLYEDSEHMWRVLNSPLGEEMLASVSAAGMMGLAWYDSGARSFYLKEPIESLADFSGLKIRVQTSSLMFAMCEALAAIPKSLPEGQIYSSIQNGSIDGAENNILTYKSFSQYEVCPYFILDEHTRVPDILVGSEIALQDLNQQQLEAIKAAAKEAQAYEKELWQQQEALAKEFLEDEGVIFIELDAQTKEDFKEACTWLQIEFAQGFEEIIETINKQRE